MSKSNEKLRVFVDTNVFISAIYGSKSCVLFLHHVENACQLVLCTAVINELFEVIRRKFPGKISNADHFLTRLDFELIETPSGQVLEEYRNQVPFIVDEKDFDILVSAWIACPGVLVSGDVKHFHTTEIKKAFEVMTPSTFLKTYC